MHMDLKMMIGFQNKRLSREINELLQITTASQNLGIIGRLIIYISY